MSRDRYTDFLFATPSLLSGVARLFDFWGLFTSYNISKNRRAADAEALYSDWRAVGSDIGKATSKYSHAN